MIAVDTNILARYYVDDTADAEAVRQRPLARELMCDSPAVFVPVTVLLEFAWVLRAFYAFGVRDCVRVFEHLLGLPNVSVEDWTAVQEAVRLHAEGLDFADALHLARCRHCDSFHTFDDRKFARKAARLGASPRVVVV